jgi:hypothetical protein
MVGGWVVVVVVVVEKDVWDFWNFKKKKPNNSNNVRSGPLNGNGIKLSRIAPPGASTSLNSPGCRGSSSSLIRRPRALNPAGRLERVPASIS